MTYHILHITTPNILLYVEKGFLFCRFDDESENKIPIDDLRAIIIATHQVGFSNSCLARLLENDVIILHCDNHYKPTGWSVGLDRVIRTKAFYNQIKKDESFENKLWKTILKSKVVNQSENLRLSDCDNKDLENLINKPLMSEANIAKQYWGKYFDCLGVNTVREHQNAEGFENACLNYGYAVISSLIYRSVLIHGLCPNIGIHHKENYRSIPLVYDLLEPFRAFVDYYLYKFKLNNEGSFRNKKHKEWSKYLACCLQNYKLKYKNSYYKIIDYVDIYIEALVRAYINFDVTEIITPNLSEVILKIDD